jgi:hypothetical protein
MCLLYMCLLYMRLLYMRLLYMCLMYMCLLYMCLLYMCLLYMCLCDPVFCRTHCQTSGYSLTAQEPHITTKPLAIMFQYWGTTVVCLCGFVALQDALPDKRLLSNSPGAPQQYNPHHHRGHGSSTGRHTVPPHQQL